MDVNGLIRMVTRMLTRKLVNKGVNAGINLAASRGKDPAQMTPEEHAQAQKTKDVAKRMRQAQRLTRRIGKF